MSTILITFLAVVVLFAALLGWALVASAKMATQLEEDEALRRREDGSSQCLFCQGTGLIVTVPLDGTSLDSFSTWPTATCPECQGAGSLPVKNKTGSHLCLKTLTSSEAGQGVVAVPATTGTPERAGNY